MQQKNTTSQHGFSLILSLMVLAILSIAGLAAAGMSTTELRIAQNESSALKSFEAAEAGLRSVIRSPATRQAEINPFQHGVDPVTDLRTMHYDRQSMEWSADVQIKPLGPPLPCPISNVAAAGTDKCVYYEIESTSVDGPGRGGSRSVTGSVYVKVSDGDASTFYTAD